MIILIDNGHGVNTPGKCSPDGLFRERYTADEEFALQRKMLNVMHDPSANAYARAAIVAEFEAYNTYVTGCKAKAKELLTAAAQGPQEPGAATV